MGLPIGGGIGLATSDGGALTPVDYFGDVLVTALGDAWSQYRPRLEVELTRFLGTGDLIARGFTLYDIGVAISHDLAYSIDRDGSGDVVISVTTGTNTIRAHSTQPTPAGKWADPALSVSFGLTFSYVLDIPPMTGPLSATGLSHARILAPRVRPENLIADIAFFLNDVLDFVSGTDWIARIEQLVADADFASVVNGALAPLNAELTRLAAQGYWFLDVVVDELDGRQGTLHAQSFPGFESAPADRLELMLTVHGYERTGVIEGEVQWPASLGAPGLPITRPFADVARISSAALVSSPAVASIAAHAAVTAVTADMTPAAQAAVPRVTTEIAASAPVDDVDRALLSLAPADRAVAVDELRAASVSRLVSVLGPERVQSMLAQFAGRVADLEIDVTTPVGNGPYTFPTPRSVGRLAGLWAADDDTTCRRRYRLVDVAIDAPLTVTVALAKGQVWRGSVTEVFAEPYGWDGTITVHKALPKPALGHVGDTRLLSDAVRVPDIAVSVAAGSADEVALNPQPLPPKETWLRRALDRGTEVSLNPQPLPPKEIGGLRRRLGGADVTDMGIDVVALGRARDLVSHPHIDPDVLAHTRIRSDPTGYGLVTGIDFTLQEYHPPIIH